MNTPEYYIKTAIAAFLGAAVFLGLFIAAIYTSDIEAYDLRDPSVIAFEKNGG